MYRRVVAQSHIARARRRAMTRQILVERRPRATTSAIEHGRMDVA